MGFLGDLWNGLKTAAAIAVAAPIAAGVWAADKVGLIDLPDEVGQAEAIDENSSAAEINDSAEMLEKYRSKYRADGERIEREVQNRITAFFDNLVDELEANKDFTAEFDTSSLHREQRKLMREIRGSLTSPISIRISMDDNECMDILSMKPGPQKKSRMDRFCQEVVQDARDNLEYRIEDVLYRQTDEISSVLYKYVENKSSSAERKKKELDEMEKAINASSDQVEQVLLKSKTKIYALEEIKKLIAG